MGIYAVKPAFQKMLGGVAAFLIRNRVHPTTINLAGLLVSVVAGIVFSFTPQFPSLWWYIPIMAFVRTACNALDGMVARTLKVKHQEWGEVLNEFLDRVSDAAIFFGLAVASYTNLTLGSVTTIIILLNSYLSIVSKAAGGTRQYGGVMGKADRMIYLGIMAILIFVTEDYAIANYALFFIGIGTIITMLQRWFSIRKELNT